MRWLPVMLLVLAPLSACMGSGNTTYDWNKEPASASGADIDVDKAIILVRGSGPRGRAGSFVLPGDRRIEQCWEIGSAETPAPGVDLRIVPRDPVLAADPSVQDALSSQVVGRGCTLRFMKAGTYDVEVDAKPTSSWSVRISKVSGPQTRPFTPHPSPVVSGTLVP